MDEPVKKRYTAEDRLETDRFAYSLDGEEIRWMIDHIPTLTEREIKVLRLIGEKGGESSRVVQDAGEKLGVTSYRIRCILFRIKEKRDRIKRAA